MSETCVDRICIADLGQGELHVALQVLHFGAQLQPFLHEGALLTWPHHRPDPP